MPPARGETALKVESSSRAQTTGRPLTLKAKKKPLKLKHRGEETKNVAEDTPLESGAPEDPEPEEQVEV